MSKPDFEQIARRIAAETGVGRLEEWDSDDPSRVEAAIAEQLRQIWNARGAADLKEFDAAIATQLQADASHQTNIDLNAVAHAIRSVDR